MADINVTISEPDQISVTVDGGVTSLPGLNDVSVTTPSNEDHLMYNSTSGKWENTVLSSGSGDVTGPGSSTDENIAVFNSTTGKIIKDFGTNISAVTSNTTHRGLTNDPHSVTATQVGLGSVSNVATDDTAYNATSWNTNLDSATKNAIRDKVETMDTAIGLNTSKVTNVSTNLSEGTSTETTVDVDSSDGTNATLVSASATRAGLLTKAKFDEIVANNAKNTNVSTDLSAGTLTATTIDVDSSDGTNATLVEADTTNAGILGSDKWDEIVANSVHTAGDGSDHADVASNTSASHTQNTDTALGSGAVAADHGTDSTDQIINVSYGTSATPPTASTTTEGSLYVQYTA